MSRANLPNGLHLEYDTFGSRDDPALLLVMGFSSQMISWDERFCEMLANAGRFVIRFDNRDVGLSSHLDGQPADPMGVMAAFRDPSLAMPEVAYTLSDMAADAIGLLDALEIDRAHVLGMSMGGMIVQTLAIEHPTRLLSVTSVMSTIGDLAYGRPTTEALAALLSPPATTREGTIEQAATYAVFKSKRYYDLAADQRRAAQSWDRSFYPEGAPRQLAAIYASGDRTDALRGVTVPMLVIHGYDDTLIDISGGRRTAELVPNASLLEVADMGHDFPEPLWPLIVGTVVGFTHVHADDQSATVQTGVGR